MFSLTTSALGFTANIADLAAAFMLLRKPEYNFLGGAKKVRILSAPPSV